ncbi:MAG: hypothetical protein ACU0DK_06815 [Pseudooceanicola sp.]
MKKTLILLALGVPLASPVIAGHANPWATEEDDLLMQYHEENLAKSIDTPGEDEMLGRMVQNATGKLGDRPGASADGDPGGHGHGRGRD